MAITLPALPYAPNALEPHMSRETLELHHGKHHRTYVEKTNQLLADQPELANLPLEQIVMRAEDKLFNNAAQAWNHSFLWKCLTPEAPPIPEELRRALEQQFGDEDAFEKKFSEMAAAHFGSGWAWLVRKPDRSLEIITTPNAGTPITDGLVPLLTCDVWEHAYYVDYRNDRAQYLQHFWPLVNWEFVEANLMAPPPEHAGRQRAPQPGARH